MAVAVAAVVVAAVAVAVPVAVAVVVHYIISNRSSGSYGRWTSLDHDSGLQQRQTRPTQWNAGHTGVLLSLANPNPKWLWCPGASPGRRKAAK